MVAPYSGSELNDPSFGTQNFGIISPPHPPHTELGIISPSFEAGNAAVDDSGLTRFWNESFLLWDSTPNVSAYAGLKASHAETE